jgi:hypothetical protein
MPRGTRAQLYIVQGNASALNTGSLAEGARKTVQLVNLRYSIKTLS